MKTKILLSSLLLAIIVACAPNPQLTETYIEDKFPHVAELKRRMDEALSQDLLLLSPQVGHQVTQLYTQANELAMQNDLAAVSMAQRGLEKLTIANQHAARSRSELGVVLDARLRAMEAQAHITYQPQFEEADRSLHTLTTLFEVGKAEQAKAAKKSLAKRYSQLELDALKGATVDQAKIAFQLAKTQKVDKLAPKTMQQAADQIQMAEKVLEVDRRATAEASKHADEAINLTAKSTQIVNLLHHFKQNKMSEEEMILWYQSQLSHVIATIEPDPPFTLGNQIVISELRRQVDMVMRDNAALLEQLEVLEKSYAQEMAEKERDLASMVRAASEERLRNRAFDSKFIRIKNMFSGGEAQVLRQGDDILIRAHGFDFMPGKSDIQPKNYVLLNKLKMGIELFPTARVLISGHTDSSGRELYNLKLSEARAGAVEKFLVEVSGIGSERVSSIGRGELQPVVSNNTPEGKATNRRVEILIKNS